ncbi:hypothetical protein [Sphingopyxis sp. R3-92]|uniref:hypothetical protein n=1 Tax=Sphingopyxis sp. R3-92 TaxID=3158553 RepID=UPI003EE48340
MTPQNDGRTRGDTSPPQPPLPASEQSLFAAIAQSEFHNRRRRDSLIGHALFAEPAWDMMLRLYIEHHRRQDVDISQLCASSAVAATTALRWIGILIEHKLITHSPAGTCDADIRLRLSTQGIEEMERYLRDRLYRERLGGDVAAGLQGRHEGAREDDRHA